jgi:glycosyltransferase involved in cell wall biosynthesis
MTKSQDSNPRFTVIIPVKDRAAYLYHTLRTCSSQGYDNLEVIVSDDGSTDNLREVVEEAARKDPRIRYVSPGRGVGMRDNFEFALNQVRPGFVMALGGDDALLPHGIEGMRNALRDADRELLAWPAPLFIYPKALMPTGQMVLPTKARDRIIRSNDFLRKQATNLYYVSDLESPMIYVKGVTSTRLVDKVRSRSAEGRFYTCSTPDGYSGIVLAGEVESYAYSAKPFSMHGTSPASQGFGYLAKSDQAKEQSEAFFKSAARIPMHAELGSQPYSPLISLMTADFLLTARDLPGWPGTVPAIDYKRLLLTGLGELADGLFADERISRELAILSRVADKHGLSEFFRTKVRHSRRNVRKRLEGNAYSPNRIYVDCSLIGVENIFDAGYVAHYLSQISSGLNLATIWRAMSNSFRYRLRSLPLGARFPSESEWA